MVKARSQITLSNPFDEVRALERKGTTIRACRTRAVIDRQGMDSWLPVRLVKRLGLSPREHWSGHGRMVAFVTIHFRGLCAGEEAFVAGRSVVLGRIALTKLQPVVRI